jgi:hypothetical protein
MSYIGSTPTTQSFIAGTDYFNGDGSTVAFTLSRSVVSVNDIEAVINNVEQQPNTAYTVSGTTITFTSAPSAGTSNIYVRYLSTTTQSITPSQNTVSYSTLNSDNQSKLGISFKNRIINGAMTIAQRGTSSSDPASGQYVLDRFATYVSSTGKLSIAQSSTAPVGFVNSLAITSSSSYSVSGSDYFFIQQGIEGYNIADLNWGTANAKTVTMSFWVRSSLTGTFGGSLENEATDRCYVFSYTINAANTWEYKTITIVGCPDGTWNTTNANGIKPKFSVGSGPTVSGTAGSWGTTRYFSATGAVSVVGTSGATFYITGIQFEVGTQATTFDYRSYGTELVLCQRYFEKSFPTSVAPANNADNCWFTIAMIATNAPYSNCYTFAVQKRTTPTLTSYAPTGLGAGFSAGQGQIFASGSWQNVTGTNPQYLANSIQFNFNFSGSATQAYLFACSWTASAEL